MSWARRKYADAKLLVLNLMLHPCTHKITVNDEGRGLKAGKVIG